MFWSPYSIITIIFPFTSAPVNDDDVWELHTWESDVFMWWAAWDWVLKSVRVHGMPKGFAETVPWNCDYFTHTYEQSVSRVLRFQRKTLCFQTSFTQGNEDAKHCHIQPPKKISTVCVLDINMALSPNRTSGNMKREQKSQDRKRRMINRKPKETITSWFSLSTFRWSCGLHVYLQMQITTKPSFAVMTTIYNLSNHDVMCYFWHEVNSELKSSNFASCILGSSRVSGGWFCQHSDSLQRRVLLSES